MESRIVKSDFKDLNAFVKSLDLGMVVDVGIFGKKASRTNMAGKKDRSAAGNPDIGAVHEFGSKTKKIPERSFLRVPIFNNSDKIIEKASKNAALHLSKGNIVQVLKDLGIACEEAIYRAFQSSGPGWDKLKDPTRGGKNRRGNGKPLIDTAQLMRSISSVVRKA